MAILWGAPPPDRPCRAGIHLLCVKATETRTVAVCGPLVGLQMHWNGERSIPCQGSEECPDHELPCTWKGFMHVLCQGWHPKGRVNSWHPWVLVLSEEIGRDALAWTPGQVLEVMRLGGRSNGPLSWRPSTKAPPSPLPSPIDVKPYVLRAAGLPQGRQLRLRRAQ